MPRFRVVIIGAGLAGLGAAIALRRKREGHPQHTVTVLERSAEIGQDNIGGYVQIPPNAGRAIDSFQCGLWEDLKHAEKSTKRHRFYRYDDGSMLDLQDHELFFKTFGYG